jgi:WD40 repeat protein
MYVQPLQPARSKGLDVGISALADFIERHELPLSSCAFQVYIIGPLFAPGSSPLARALSVVPSPRLVTPQPAMPLVYPIVLDGGASKTCVAVSPDGSAIAVGSKDQTIHVWNTTDLTHRVFQGHTDSVCAIAFSPDGRHLVSGSKDATVRVWDLATATEIEQWQGNRIADLVPVASRRAGSQIFRAITRWCGRVSTRFERLVGLGICIGRANPATGPTNPTTAHRFPVLAVAFNCDGKCIISGSADQDIIGRGNGRYRLQDHTGPVTAAAVSPDGFLFATGSTDKTIRMRSTTTYAMMDPFAHADEVYCMAFSPDSVRLVSGCKDGTIYLWDVRTGEHRVFARRTQPVNSVTWPRGSPYFLSASEDGTVCRWDGNSGEGTTVIREQAFSIRVTDIDASPDGHQFVASSRDGRVYILNRGVRALADWRNSGADAIKLLACSADGVFLAACGPDTVLRIWDIQTGEAVGIFEGAGSYSTSLDFSPDSSRIIMNYGDGSQDMWTVDYDFPRPASPPASAMEVAVTFSGDSDGWLYFTRASDMVLTRYCWVPHDRRWSNWSSQAAWANGVLAIGTDGGVITILDFTSVWGSQS